ncbi:MAG: pyruvate kinase, partial [Coriobacteriales bacterium]
ELSYGSHMFQDLIEADIGYGAVLENSTRIAYRPEIVEQMHDITDEVLGDVEEGLGGIVGVYRSDERDLWLWRDSIKDETLCGFEK